MKAITTRIAFLIAVCASCTGAAAEPEEIRVRAEVIRYLLAVEEDLFDDGTSRAYDAIEFRILAPRDAPQKLLRVLIDSRRLPDDSALRAAGVVCQFSLGRAEFKLKTLHWGALRKFRVQAPRAGRPTTRELRSIERELASLAKRAEKEKGPHLPRSAHELAYYLLRGLAADHPQAPLGEAELKLFGHQFTRRPDRTVRMSRVTEDVYVIFDTAHLQDKSGSYTNRTATYFRRSNGEWTKLGWGRISTN